MDSTLEPQNWHVPTPKTPHESSRDDMLRVQTLYYDASWSIDDIMLQIPTLTKRQILYAIDHKPTPQKHLIESAL